MQILNYDQKYNNNTFKLDVPKINKIKQKKMNISPSLLLLLL